MKWENVQIGQIGEVITGNTPPRKNPELYGDFVPFIKPTDIEIDRRFTPNPEECYSELGFEKYKKSLIPRGSTCVVTIGSIGKKITQAITDCFINQAVNAVIPNENYDKDFVFYLLKNNLDKVKGLDSGTSSGRENVSKSSFSNIEVKVTKHFPTQQRIASILSAYDDLIENNLKRIKLLEEKAFLRYKQILKEEKLEEKSILDICFITDGTHDSPKQQIDGFYLVTGKHLIEGFIDFSSAYFISHEDHDKIQKRSKVVNGDLVLSNIGTIGNVAIIDSPFEFSVKNVIIFKPIDSVFTAFLYCYLNSAEMQTRFQQESSGTSQRFISLAYTRALKVNLPGEDVLEEFHKDVSSLLKLKSILNKQNAKLSEARDILLPRLMSGQIEV
jgi:type I restriction enzyme S subunit